MRWYLSLDGKTTGPHDAAALSGLLAELVQSGQALDWLHVRDDMGGSWMPVGKSPFSSVVGGSTDSSTAVTRPSAAAIAGSLLIMLAGVALLWAATARNLSDTPSTLLVSAPGTKPPPTEQASLVEPSAVWEKAQHFVKLQLRSPGSATFGPLSPIGTAEQERIVRLGQGKYRIRGWVDSDDGFGRKVRSDFDLTLQHNGDERWVVLEGPAVVQR